MSGQSAISIKDENERDIPDEIMTAKLLVESNELRDGIRSGGVIGDGGLSPQGDGSKPSTNGSNTSSNTSKPKRTSLACIRCRTRHIRCPGGDPCKKCQLAKTKCEYIEADKKIVVSMKYLSKLHDDIARLKKDNAMLRNNIKDEEKKNLIPPAQPIEQNSFANNIRYSQNNDIQENANNFSNEVIQPSLDKYGRLIQSRTGEKVYVGSSSMTLFGLEIQNMVPSFVSSSLFPNSTQTSPDGSPATTNTPKPHISETSDIVFRLWEIRKIDIEVDRQLRRHTVIGKTQW
jgi:proline utilization trans-activator